MLKVSALLCGTIATFMPAHVFAQSISDPNSNQPQSDAMSSGEPIKPASSSAMNEIVVTAQRRAERLVDVPLSVDLVDRKEIASKHIDSLSDLTKAVTSLRFEGQAPQFEPTLRGIGTLVQGGGVDASVAVYLDGVYLPNSSGMYFNLPDVSSLQVLKGPQGTLFGRNTTGGAILISTSEPSFDWTGNAKATYESYHDGRLQGYISGPLTSNIAVGVSSYYRESPGYMVNIANGHHDARVQMFDVRPSIMFDNHDNLKVRIIYEHNYTFDTSGLGIVNVDGYALARNFPGAIISSEFPNFSVDTKPVNKIKADAFTGIIDYKLNDTAALKSVTSYRKDSNLFVSDADMSNLPLLSVAQSLKFDTFSQELTLSHKAGRLDLVAGANYYNSIVDSPFTSITTFGVEQIIDSSKIKTRAIGIFADGTYEVARNLFLTAGARFSSETKDLAIEYGGVPPKVTDSAHWNAFTPRAALRYQIDPGDNVYVSFNRGFKPGSYAGFPPNLVKPEHVTAYEAGYKHAASFFDLSAAAFYYSYTDFQVTTFDFNTGLGITINAQKERTYGLEVETTFRPAPHWRISFSAAHLDAKFTDFKNAEIQVQNGIGQWVPAPQDATGTRVPRSPKWSGNASTTYDLNVGPGTIELSANLSFASSLYNLMNEQFLNPSYGQIGANIAFTPNGGHWRVEAFVTNLNNKHLYAQYQGGPFGTYALFLPPRVFGAALSYHF